MIAAIEKDHEARFNCFLEQLNTGKVFTKDGEVIWVCRNCGHIHTGKEAPLVYPVCKKQKAYFEVKTGIC